MTVKTLTGVLTLMLTMTTVPVAMAELHPYAQKDKFGYMDDAGNVVIKPKYQHATTFVDGIAKVQKGNKWGYIDESGNAVIALQYDNIEPFENGVARVKKGNKYGFIRTDGSFVIKPDFEFIGSFNDAGYVWVGKGKTLAEAKKGLYKYAEELIKPQYLKLGFFVATDSVDYTDGRVMFPSVPDEITSNFSRLSLSHLHCVWASPKVGQYTVLSLQGNACFPTVKGYIGAPRDGVSLIMTIKSNALRYNYVKADGRGKKLLSKDRECSPADIVNPPCYPFHNGLAACSTGSGMALYNTEGNPIGAEYGTIVPVGDHGYITMRDEKYGLLGKDGSEVLAPSYNRLSASTDVINAPVLAARDDNGLCGFIDMNGKEVVPFVYEDAMPFQCGYGYMKKSGSWGVIGVDGREVVAPAWDSIIMCVNDGDDVTWVHDVTDKLWYCHSLVSDSRVSADGYAAVCAFNSDGRAMVSDGSLYGVVNSSGSRILPIRFSSTDGAAFALRYIDAYGLSSLTDADAYRINIRCNPNLHKFKLEQTIAAEM